MLFQVSRVVEVHASVVRAVLVLLILGRLNSFSLCVFIYALYPFFHLLSYLFWSHAV